MALYDNKHWLLSHIRNSFISTDDTGMCELVMVGEDITKHLADKLDCFPETEEDSEEDEDEIEHESYDIQLDMDFAIHRQRSNTAARLEKMDLARKRAAKIKHIKWEMKPTPISEEDLNDMFTKKDISQNKQPSGKSLLTEQLEKCTNLPQNPYMEYAKFDGSAQVGIPTRKYKIFLTMLPEEQRNYPMAVCCIATAKIQELIGLICLKCSTIHGDFPLQPVNTYGLYITEEDGEVDRDFPCLDPRECVAKFGFTCLGLVEHKHTNKSVSFDSSEISFLNESVEEASNKLSKSDFKADNSMQILKIMKGHTKAMEAPLYQSYRVFIINKVRSKIEIHLGISGEKIEIDPVQQKNSKFALVKQKPVSHPMDSIAWCEVTDTRSSRSTFRVVYSSSFGKNIEGTDTNVSSKSTSFSPLLQNSTSFKHYDFEADHCTAEEIVQKISLILEQRSSNARRKYLVARERKLYKRKSFNINK